MPTLTIEYQSDAERLILEQAIAYASAMQRHAAAAPHGTVIAACEQLALTQGRKFLQDTLAITLQAQALATDSKKNSRNPQQRTTRTLAPDRRRMESTRTPIHH